MGDQLNINHSWFNLVAPSVTYVLMEIKSETDYATHHIQKIIGFFAAMRNFALELRSQGHDVIYFHLNDETNLHSFSANCIALISKMGFSRFEYLEPDEYRVDEHLKDFLKTINIPHKVFETEHFYTTRNELHDFFGGKKNFLMESFYRHQRKKHHILMEEGDKPMFGKWNFDEENRQKLPKNHKPVTPLVFENDLNEIEEGIRKAGVKTIGSVDSRKFIWPINRNQALQLMDYFLKNCLPLFGTFQDSMAPDEWSIYHSRLSFSMNTKLISPKEVVDKAIREYFVRPDEISFNQLEGFVRQIVGWREYMRGIYWAKMPGYAELNYFNHTKPLPEWFWDGKTNMNCLMHTILQSLAFGYAHHIQRLMVTGNFALLAGVHPDEVDAWYLGIYVDALDWVEITNTRGMSQFADGGIVGTKPYVSSAAYLNKMGTYCENCYYDKAKKTGDRACPFNSLYWNFYSRNEDKLAKNPRIGMMYRVWHKMDPEAKSKILEQADLYLRNISSL